MTLFYSESQPYYEFSNFYTPKIPFTIYDIDWKNTEACYQAQKWKLSKAYQSLIAIADTPNKAYLLGKASFIHGNKNKWTIPTPSLLNPGKMTINEAIAVYTDTDIKDWKNSEELQQYRDNGTKLNIKHISYDVNWESNRLEIMKDIVWHKFNSPNHRELKDLLLNTTQDIREHTNRDLYWADGGAKGGGKNMLGQVLMYTREKLKNKNYTIVDCLSSPIKKSGSYVKITSTIYYGIHPSVVKPDFKVDHYISLVEEHEFANLPEYHHFPVKDRKCPTLEVLTEIVDLILTLKGNVYIFCKGGHGRSGTVASALYGKLNNLKGKEAIKYINQQWHEQRDLSLIRPQLIKLGSPQTQCQKNLVKEYLS